MVIVFDESNMTRMKRICLLIFGLLLVVTGSVLAQDATTTVSPPDTSALSAQEQAAIQLVASKVAVASNRTVSSLNPSGIQDLPLGVAKLVGGQTFVIAIDSGRLTPQGAIVNAYAMVGLPGIKDSLAFEGQNISINPGGVGGYGVSRISLVSRQKIQLSPQISLYLSPKDPNYVEFDCNGFKDINLTGEFVFDRSLVIPDTSTGTALQNVVATFSVNASDFTNMMFSINITPFRLPFLQDVSFQIKNAVADLSAVANPAGVVFPSDYQSAYQGDLDAWQGFYIQQLTIKLPPYLKDSSGAPIVITGSNMLLDAKGLTGSVSVSNLLSLTGSGNDWPFSIKTLGATFSMSHLTGGSMSGVVGLPFVNGDTLSYQATIAENNNVLGLSFLVSVDQTKTYSMPFGGTLKLNKGSSLTFTQKGNKLSGLANLSGGMFFNQPELKSKDSTGLQFTNLQLSTESPYIISGNFNSNVNLSCSNFPISVSDIKLGLSNGEIAIAVTVGLNLMDADDKSPAVTTTLTLLAKLDTATKNTQGGSITTQQWQFDQVQIDKILINNLQISALTLNGELDFYRDNPTYGNGFHGDITLAVQDILSNGVSANVYFGSMPTFRYWHVDVYVPTGIIPIIGPLYMDGIIGGASYQMVKKTPWTANFTQLNTTTTTPPADGLTTAEYLPDSTTGLSLMAGLTMVVATQSLANADAVLQITFRKGGGLESVEFTGGFYLLSDVDSRSRTNVTSSGGPPGNVPAYAYLDMLYDADNSCFNAQLSVYVNAYGILTGTGPQGEVGQILMHFDPQEWYVYIGQPTAMLGLKILDIATVQSYFMVGSQLEPFPPLPANVQSIAGNTNLNFMQDENAFATGGGIGFGARFNISVGVPGQNPDGSYKNKFPLPIFAQFSAGLGADIMFRQYDSAYCQGSSSPIGVGGWYASGQAYAYLSGSVGVCWSGCKKQIDFLSLSVAAVLQAKLPNPSWFQGLLAGHYSVLCGLIKGSFSFDFTIGDQCTLVGPGNELGDINVISDMNPEAGASAVSVFADPQVTFNMGINTPVQMMNDDNQMASYRVEADEIAIYNGSTVVPGKLAWNSDNTGATITTSDVLPSQANLTFSVKLHWEKQNGSTWSPLLNTDGTVDTEIKQVNFTTDVAPGYIPANNIAYNYPVPMQYNFYKNETNQGYIKLIRGQSYLFHASDSGQTNQFAAAYAAKDGSDSLLTPVSYDSVNLQVNFTIPAALENQEIYDLSILKITQAATSGANVQQVAATTQSDANNSVTVTTNNITSTQLRGGQQFLYQTNFRTSQYNSLAEKVAAFQGTDLFNIATGNVYVLMKRNIAPETFDQFEIYGQSNVFSPMVQPVASNTAPWLSNIINPTLYNNYNGSGMAITWRNPSVLGVGPVKGLQLTNLVAPDQYCLQQSDVDAGYAQTQAGQVYISYYLSYYVIQDYHDLRNQAAALYLTTTNLPAEAKSVFLWPGYIDLTQGSYPLVLQYVLPGTGQVTSSVPLSINF
jgi:hypothetical protein